MKKLISSFLMSFALLCIALNSQAQKLDVATKNMKEYNRVWDVVINEGRINILDTAYAENAMLHTSPATMGKANCIAYYANYISGFTNRQFTVKESIAQGEQSCKVLEFQRKAYW